MSSKLALSLAQPPDPAAIFQQCPPITKRYLSAIGVYPPLAPLMLLSLARIRIDPGGFIITKDGQPAIITPIRGQAPHDEPDAYLYGDTCDLVAWHPSHDWCPTLFGAGTIGTHGRVAHASVLEWFRAGCEGFAILRW